MRLMLSRDGDQCGGAVGREDEDLAVDGQVLAVAAAEVQADGSGGEGGQEGGHDGPGGVARAGEVGGDGGVDGVDVGFFVACGRCAGFFVGGHDSDQGRSGSR